MYAVWTEGMKVAEMAERNGWAFELGDPNGGRWVTLKLWKGDVYMELNWKQGERKAARLADSRFLRIGNRKGTFHFTNKKALEIIETY